MLEAAPPPKRTLHTRVLVCLLAGFIVGALWLACAGEPGAAPSDPTGTPSTPTDQAAEKPSTTIYHIGVTPADTDTSLDDYLTSPGGISDQCDRLNDLLRAVCCPRFDIGCDVSYNCDPLPTDTRDRMAGTAYFYLHESSGAPGYALHHGSVQQDLTRHLRGLHLYGRLHRRIPVAYSRHPLRIDDEETKTEANKIDRRDPTFLLLGSILPGLSQRNGTRMNLDYYASRDGLLLSVAPANRSSLAQAIAEYRADLFSFDGKQFTGHGARDLFDLAEGEAVPRLSGCQALAIQEPSVFRSYLGKSANGGK